jgi:hypothetical protein
MKSPRLRKWLFAVAIILTLGVLFASYLAKPLPPPHVSLQFQGFKPDRTKIMTLTCETNYNGEVSFYASADGMFVHLESKRFLTSQTNSLAIICMTNHGPTRIWWTAWMDCRVEARTANGWITNQAARLSWVPYSVPSSATDTFGVCVPSDAIEWRVHGWYGFYKRHNAREELFGWFNDDLGFGIKFPGDKHKPRILEFGLGLPIGFIAGILGVLPEPQKEYGEVSSELFTNKPPLDLPPGKAIP